MKQFEMTKPGVYSSSRPGMYSNSTSKITGLLGATLGRPGAELSPFGNASWTKYKNVSANLSASATRLYVSFQ